MLAKLTLIGLNEYYKQTHPTRTLFDNLTLPNNIDKGVCVNHILLRYGEFCVLYPNPDFMYDAIKIFSDTYNRTFTKWADALNIEYSPLENYDRFEDWRDIGESINTISSNTTDRITNDQTITKKVSPFENNEFQNSNEDSASVINDSTAWTAGRTDINTDNTRTGHTHGNIGVTTSQQMLEAELNISKWNIYENIAKLFANEFCIMIY